MLSALLRALMGFVLACIIAAIVKVGFIITPAEILNLPLNARLPRLETFALLATAAALHSAVFAAPFAAIAAMFGAWLKIRAWLYYLFAGLAISMFGFAAQYVGETTDLRTIANTYAVTAYAVTGLVAGWVYWLVAGRYVGSARARDDSPQKVITDDRRDKSEPEPASA